MYNRMENEKFGDEDLQKDKENEMCFNGSSAPLLGGSYGSISIHWKGRQRLGLTYRAVDWLFPPCYLFTVPVGFLFRLDFYIRDSGGTTASPRV